MGTQTQIEHVGIGTILERNSLSVPSNQRSYSWKEQQIDDLLMDISTAIQAGESEYFIGSIVLTKPDSGRPNIVDGQQRLASITMIFAAMRDYLMEIGENEIAKDLAKQFLSSKDKWSSTEEPKIQLSNQDSIFFLNYVLRSPDSEDRLKDPINRLWPDSHKRIANAFNKIIKFIKDNASSTHNPQSFLQKWEKYLTSSVMALVLTVEDESNAFQIFETLNDRGLDLATSDLLKNYLFGRVGKDKIASVMHQWSSAISKGGETEEATFKKFIHHFWASKNGLTREKLLYQSIKDKVKTSNLAFQFVSELNKDSSIYAAILNPDHEIWSPMGHAAQEAISTLQRLKLEQYKPLLLACMDTIGINHPNEIAKLLEVLVSWSVRFRITQQFGTSRLETFYQNGGMKVRTQKLTTASDVVDLLKGSVPNDTLFKQAFSDLTEENAKIVRYYLHKLESILRKQRKITENISIDEKEINLEHVLPKEPDLSVWKSFTIDTVQLYRYRLGNQTLLPKAKNEKIGNHSFDVKKKAFAASNICLNEKFTALVDWNENAIESRQKEMAELALIAWPI